ncbi:MAG: transposase [Terracidiphilus sp.]
MTKRRVGKYPLSFRQMAVGRMKDCPSVSALAKELGIDRSNLYEWQRQLEQANESSLRVTSPVRELRKQVGELKRVLAEKTLEVDFFKGALQKVEARRQSSKGSGGTASTTRSGK